MSITRLLFATTNQNKLFEVRQKLGSQFQIDDLSTLSFHGELPETHETLTENAIEKAQYIYDHFGCDCFAEDTGLVIPALNGEPGVYSARYAGPGKNFEDNIQKVLDKMQGQTNRSAYFQAVIALIQNGNITTFEGRCDGVILAERIGNGGFGYDSIFMANGMNKSFAEIALSLKNEISHRIKALDKMIAFLKSSS